jgi:membrane-bound ClpP family serine protease
MDAATWAILLLTLGLIFLVLEFFVPSGGALGVLCGLSLVAAIAIGFFAGRWTGLGIMLTVAVVVPTAMAVAVRWWPDTPIGRMILVPRPKTADEVLPETIHYRGLKDFVGRRGIAKGLMLPSGSVVIDGKAFDAVSEGMAIEPGTAIFVVGVSTQRLVVRPDSTIRAELADTFDSAAAAHELADTFEPPQPQSLQPEPRLAPPAEVSQPLVADIPDPFADIKLPE